ncbi:MAG: hypothetical protein GTO53_01825 [Planctomycetales bacterium]|nr:hypothetical protein [Planctomycetales bacterium]NIM07910.1 hypothetical protein [Planctomycetales bacterium]NIN07397.1 hypothetical protein [Planctomycetales bacterium]NIN76501.1 hypothetical protein [Planctomycetales bacterium]NIO33691.1 hypothetical protein [Planctomycetales bacterium]
MRNRFFLPLASRSRPALAPLAALVLALEFSLGLTANVPAADFAMESRAFDGSHKKPFATNTTLFHEGLVYDFVNGSDEVTLLDKSRGRLVLMDKARQVKTELTTDQILRYTQHIREWAAGKSDLLLQFYANPNFDVVDDGDHQLKLTADLLTYQVVGSSPAPEIVRQYREFCDWYARLNSAVHPGSQLPFPRLLLNNHLARRQLVPTQVQLTLAPQQRFGGKPVRWRTEHTLRAELSSEDLQRIDQAGGLLVTLKPIPLTEYRQAPRTARR